jgi:hypothetical protein
MYRLRGALMVWRGQVVPIVSHSVGPEGTTYLLHTRHPQRGLVIDQHVTIGLLMAELCTHAGWCVGDRIELGPHERRVQARWWNTRRGQVMYRLADPRSGRTAVVPQDELSARVLAYQAA